MLRGGTNFGRCAARSLAEQSIGLDFNTSKCHVMTFTRRRDNVNFTYSVNGVSLETSGESVVDLGITFDRRLSFHSQIERIRPLKCMGLLQEQYLILKFLIHLRRFIAHFCVLTWNIEW